MAKSPYTPEFRDMKLYGTIILLYIENEGHSGNAVCLSLKNNIV